MSIFCGVCVSYILFLLSCKTPGVHQKFREKIGALLVTYDSAQQQLTVVVSELKLERIVLRYQKMLSHCILPYT